MGSERVDVDLTVKTATGTTTFTLGVSTKPAPLATLVPVCQQITEVVVSKAIEHEQASGHDLSCRAGCGACCRQLVPISAPEAFFLADHIIGLPQAQRDAVLTRFERASEDLNEAGLRADLQALMRDADSPLYRDLSMRYFAAGVACPFLVDESCSVHAARPIICRDYNVTSPSDWCSQPRLHTIRRVKTPPTPSPALADVTAKLLGSPTALIPLTLAMEWVEENAELGVKTWPTTTLFQMLTEALGIDAAIR